VNGRRCSNADLGLQTVRGADRRRAVFLPLESIWSWLPLGGLTCYQNAAASLIFDSCDASRSEAATATFAVAPIDAKSASTRWCQHSRPKAPTGVTSGAGLKRRASFHVRANAPSHVRLVAQLG
jgi:hypothetical protein